MRVSEFHMSFVNFQLRPNCNVTVAGWRPIRLLGIRQVTKMIPSLPVAQEIFYNQLIKKLQVHGTSCLHSYLMDSMHFPTMPGSFLLRIFQVIQTDRTLKHVTEFKIPSLPNTLNAHNHAYITSNIYCMSIKHLLGVTFCDRETIGA